MPAKEPRPASFFRLKLGGNESVGVFQQVSGLDSQIEVVEHKSVDEQGRPRVTKVAGQRKWSDIVLKRGVDENLKLFKWHQDAAEKGADAVKVDGIIELLDISGSPIATYSFEKGWPISYTGATLDATTNNVALEEVKIAHEGVMRV